MGGGEARGLSIPATDSFVCSIRYFVLLRITGTANLTLIIFHLTSVLLVFVREKKKNSKKKRGARGKREREENESERKKRTRGKVRKTRGKERLREENS